MNRLQEIRKEMGLNMSEMAKHLGIPYTTYVGYEKEERGLYSESLKMLSEKLNVSIDYILYKTDNKKTAIKTDDGDNFDEWKSIIDQLTPENAALLKDQAQVFLKHQKVQGDQ